MNQETPQPKEQPSEPKPSSRFRKGALIKVKMDSYKKIHNDSDPPRYIFEGPGEILMLKGEYAQIRWRRPVPDVWIQTDLLEIWR